MALTSSTTVRWSLAHDHEIHTLPVLVLFPHGGCNCRCLMCDIWKANKDHRELSYEDISAQMADLRVLGVRLVTLSGGEALMSSNLWKLCELLQELDVTISLMSTGLLLERHAQDVVKWCDAVTVSIDGSSAVHDGIRRVSRAFDRLAGGVAAIKALRPDLPVIGRCVIQRANYRDMPYVIHSAKAIGLDKLSFLPADVSSEAFNRPTPWDVERVSEVALTRAEAAEFIGIVEDVILHYEAEISSGFIHEGPDALRRLPRYYLALHNDGDFPPMVCNAPWVSAVVEADNSVRPCYFHRPIGNLREHSLLAILNSERARTFRRDLDVQADPVCRRCVCPLYLPRAASGT